MNELDLFFRFGVAIAIGVLVGLQREYAFNEPSKELFGGVRTFALLGLIGCSAALVTEILDSPWPFIAIVLVAGAFVTVAYYVDAVRGQVGLTTEVSAMITILTGALVYWNHLILAIAIGVATTVLLSIKVETQQFVRQITRQDLYATLKFAVITAIVLPILPNETFGPPPFDVLNPYTIWLLVVFISAISFLGYVLIKVIGVHRSILLLGLLGGLASSTAVTLSFTQRSQEDQLLAKPFALAIIIAWTVMFARVLAVVAVVNAALLQSLWLPIVAAVGVGLAYSLYLFTAQQPEKLEEVRFSNPFQLLPAFKFGLMFMVILLISRTAQLYFGTAGIYLSSIVSGLADVNAITLSVAQLSRGPRGLETIVATQAIVLATVANTFVKGGIVLLGGSVSLRRAILPGFILMMVTGIVFAFLV